MSFGGEGSSKREAEKNAAALACVELEVGRHINVKISGKSENKLKGSSYFEIEKLMERS